MTHPLTDHIIESELATPAHFVSGSLVGLFTHDDIRNAADWQLEQVMEQWGEVVDSDKTDIEAIREFDKRLKAMRSQQQEDNQ